MRRYYTLAAVGVVLVFGVTGCGGSGRTTAQPAPGTATMVATTATSPPTTGTPVATEPGDMPTVVYPYRIILSGPATAYSGEQVTYDIQYQCVSQLEAACRPGGAAINIGWPPAAASYVASDQPNVDPRSLGVTYGLAGPGGTIHLTLQIAAGFTGQLRVVLGALGRPLVLAEGSVGEALTTVLPQPAP